MDIAALESSSPVGSRTRAPYPSPGRTGADVPVRRGRSRWRRWVRANGSSTAGRVAMGLGWFSIALGVTLAAAATRSRANNKRLAVAAASALSVGALDVLCARRLQRAKSGMQRGAVRVVKSIAINCPPDALYRFWRDLENLPQFMYHLRSVRVTGPRTSHWVANAPVGGYVEWDAEITDDIPDRRITWRSLAGADVAHSGSVEFERRPGGRSSMVRVELEYEPPMGPASAAIAKLFNEAPDQQIEDDLRRFKQLVETGEVLRSDGNPEGVGRIAQRPARPAGLMEDSSSRAGSWWQRSTAVRTKSLPE